MSWPPPPGQRIVASAEVTRRGAELARRAMLARDWIKLRRAMVLRHPDLAARLCEPPIGYREPWQWNGYIPPDTFTGNHNDSPQRAALVAIAAEAEARETAP